MDTETLQQVVMMDHTLLQRDNDCTVNSTEVTYDPEIRFAELAAVGAVESSSGEHAGEFTLKAIGDYWDRLTSNKSGLFSWVTTCGGKVEASGEKSRHENTLAKDQCGFVQGKTVTEVSPCEHPWDPEKRFASVYKLLKNQRGAKSAEHLEVLRTSDPCYGSLAPRKDRPSAHEVTYDPLARYVALAPSLRSPRGAKSAEHLEVLRTSDPCYGSLAPKRLVEQLASLSVPLSSLRRNESNNSFVCDEDDDVASLPDETSWETRRELAEAWRKARAAEDGDTDSERSAARTLERVSGSSSLDGCTLDDFEFFDEGLASPREWPESPHRGGDVYFGKKYRTGALVTTKKKVGFACEANTELPPPQAA